MITFSENYRKCQKIYAMEELLFRSTLWLGDDQPSFEGYGSVCTYSFFLYTNSPPKMPTYSSLDPMNVLGSMANKNEVC